MFGTGINKKKNGNVLATKLKIGLSVASINVRGLTANADKRIQISALMNAHSTDIMCLEEYYVHHEHSKVELDMSNFNNYDLIFNVHNTKTIILIKKEIQHEKIDDLFCEIDGIDSSWLAVFSQKHIIIIGSVYHSPNSKYENIDIGIISDQMDIIRNRYKNEHKKIMFMINGDWNAKNLMWGSTITDNRGMNLANWLAKNNLVFINDGSPTYRNATTGKEDAIDLTITSLELKRFVVRWKIHKELSDSYNFSDHYIMESLINLNPIVFDVPDRITWNFDESLIRVFNEDIKLKMNKWKIYYDHLKNDRKNVNQLVELFQLFFVQSCMEIFGFKYYNSKDFSYLTKKVQKLIDDKRKVKNKLSHLIFQMKKNLEKRRRKCQ